MQSIAAMLALDLARERAAEGERRARLLRGAAPAPRGAPRRLLRWLAASSHRPSGDDLARRSSLGKAGTSA